MKSLPQRLISSVVAVLALFCLWYFLREDGLKLMVLLTVWIGSTEFTRLFIAVFRSRKKRWFFYTYTGLIFVGVSLLPATYQLAFFALTSLSYLILTLAFLGHRGELPSLIEFQNKSLLGFVYIAILPAFVVFIINLPHGIQWFLFLLSIVFAGDIGAYFFGVALGKTKIIPAISPQKSWQGSVGGFVCSAAASLVFAPLLQVSASSLVIVALVTALFAQFGDFFESLLKRVAEVKDSGRLMPGHGGILDRVDGVLFAAPVVYFAAQLIMV